jgi:hypothetical protein
MGLRVLRGGRRQIGDVSTYVGEFGTVFYDENTGTLRLSDGVTPGGTNTVTGNLTVGNITVTGNLTVGNISATGMITTDQTFSGHARNVGTLAAAGTVTIDFATDHMILVNLTTTATIAFNNITPGKTVSVVIRNSTGQNRAITTGVTSSHTSGGVAAPNVNNGHSGVFVYRTFGTDANAVYCEINS